MCEEYENESSILIYYLLMRQYKNIIYLNPTSTARLCEKHDNINDIYLKNVRCKCNIHIILVIIIERGCRLTTYVEFWCVFKKVYKKYIFFNINTCPSYSNPYTKKNF